MSERNLSAVKVEMPVQDPQVRAQNFEEVALGYTPEMAREEAARCLQCRHRPCVSGCPVGVRIPDFIARAGERLRGRFRLPVPAGGGNPAFSDQSVPASQQAFFAQSEVILELADQGPCVIVGRCSDYVLGGRPGCLKVFLWADLDSRVRRCLDEYHLPPAGV